MNDPIFYDKELQKLEDELSESDDCGDQPPAGITTYSELRSCADIYRMYKGSQLNITPKFQREANVWPITSQTRFIDSLIKKLPIPSMCFSLDTNTEQRMVIDGLQRISTIIKFIEAAEAKTESDKWTLSTLVDIERTLSGQEVSQIKNINPKFISRVENATIPITVVQCNTSEKSHMEYLFTIFHRLNSGGTKLNNQEIRNGIYGGDFNDLLNELAKNPKHKKLFDISVNKGSRFAYQELILRFFSFESGYRNYTGRFSKFLNDYMFDRKNESQESVANKRAFFEQISEAIQTQILTADTSRKKISKSAFDGLMIGVAASIKSGNKKNLLKKYETLINEPLFTIDNLKEGTASKTKIISRLDKAVSIFEK